MLTHTTRYLAALLGAWALSASGQRIEFDISPRALNLGEPTSARFVVKGVDQPEPPRIPPQDNLQIQYRGASREQAINYVNGRLQSEKSTTFTYTLLPTKAGTYDIGPMTYEINGQSVEIPMIRIQVVADGVAGGSGGSGSSLEDNVFVAMSTSQTNLVPQQVFDVDFTLFFHQLNLGGELSVLNLPDTGLNMQRIEERGAGREVVDGEVYEVRRFRIQFRALTEGQFTLAPTIRTQMLISRRDRRRNLFWDDPFFDRVFTTGLRGSEYESRTFRVYHERFTWFLGVGFSLLVLEAVLRERRSRKQGNTI